MSTSSPSMVFSAHGGFSRHSGPTGKSAQRRMNSSTCSLVPVSFGRPSASAWLAHEPCTFIAIFASVKPVMLSKKRAGAASPRRGAAFAAAAMSGSGITCSVIRRSWPSSSRVSRKLRRSSYAMGGPFTGHPARAGTRSEGLCGGTEFASGPHALPPLGGGRGQIELVEDAGGDVVDDVVHRLRVVVEGRHGRQQLYAPAAEREHVLQVDLAQWGLARYENELAPFLEDHVSGADHQPVGVSGANPGERLHRARHDH